MITAQTSNAKNDLVGSIAICAPSGADADTIEQVIAAIGLKTHVLSAIDELGTQLSGIESNIVSGLMVAEEALSDGASLASALRLQPVWSDLPVIILTVAGHRASSRNRWALFEGLGNVTLLARPLRREDLESAARGIVCARARQRETRAHLIELEEAARLLERRVEERTAELMAVEATLRQSQKMEAIGQLTGGLAHDFNNLLQVISSSVEAIKFRVRQNKFADLERYAQNISGATDRASALTHRLLAFSRQQTLDPKRIDVNRLVLDIFDLVKSTVGPSVSVEAKLHADPVLTLCDPPQLENALLNLCINARDAMPKGGIISIETDRVDFDEHQAKRYGLPAGAYVTAAVRDNGAGMTSQTVERAFDPFFTTKPMGQGTGLGLSMVYGFARQSQGHAAIESTVGAGTLVRMWLPELKAQGALAEVPTGELGANKPAAPATILLVDDDSDVRVLLAEILQDAGYAVIEASDGVQGLNILRSEVAISMAVSDVGMPRMNGIEMVEQARHHRPELKVLFITGYSQQPVFFQDRRDENSYLLTKPFVMDALIERVATILSQD
ncbi:response regulator [Caballeronia sp. DA-9]|uniref:response regulator n=1 Tax=Caballeronia sp. DA-9 TaxID=3436237 RepID=UPI003F681AEB